MKWNLFYLPLFNFFRVTRIFFFLTLALFLLSCTTVSLSKNRKEKKENTKAVHSVKSKSIRYNLFCQEEHATLHNQKNLCEEIFWITNQSRKVPVQKTNSTDYHFRLQIIKNSFGYTVRLYKNKQLIQTGAARSFQEAVLLSKMMINDFVPDSSCGSSNREEQNTWETF